MAKITNKSTTKPRTKTATRKTTRPSKTKVTSGNFVTSYTKFSKRKLALIGAVFAAIGCATLIYSFAATPTQTVEAETFQYPASQTSAIVPTGSKIANFWWSTTGTKSVKFSQKAVKMSVVAYGSQCGADAAKMEVKVDGVRVMLQDVKATSPTTYTVNTLINPGTHVVSLSFLNDFGYGISTCDRNLYVDKLVFSGEPVLDPATTLSGKVIKSLPANTYNYGSVGAAFSTGGGMLWSNGSATATFSLPSATDTVVVSMYGAQCDGAPQMQLEIDGYTHMAGGVDATSSKDYVIKKSHGAGTHTLKISYLNDYKTSVCDRNLFLNKVDFRSTATTTTTPAPAPAPAPTPAPAPAPAPAPTTTSYTTFWTNPTNKAKVNADKIRATRPADAALLDKIGNNPGTVWIGGYSGDAAVLSAGVAGARSTKTILSLSMYGIPFRDGGHYSGGGFADYAAYAKWVDWVAANLTDTHTYVLLETDAIAMTIPEEKRAERWKSLNYAVNKLGALPNTKVYLDGGTLGWQTPETMASRLKLAGVANADGFFVNLANFSTTDESTIYGKKISALVNNKPFVIDTSRNGNGAWTPPAGETEAWCNPPGRALGVRPTTKTGVAGVDAYVWAKVQGESDGACRGYPKAGDWIESLALEMARNAKW